MKKISLMIFMLAIVFVLSISMNMCGGDDDDGGSGPKVPTTTTGTNTTGTNTTGTNTTAGQDCTDYKQESGKSLMPCPFKAPYGYSHSTIVLGLDEKSFQLINNGSESLTFSQNNILVLLFYLSKADTLDMNTDYLLAFATMGGQKDVTMAPGDKLPLDEVATGARGATVNLFSAPNGTYNLFVVIDPLEKVLPAKKVFKAEGQIKYSESSDTKYTVYLSSPDKKTNTFALLYLGAIGSASFVENGGGAGTSYIKANDAIGSTNDYVNYITKSGTYMNQFYIDWVPNFFYGTIPQTDDDYKSNPSSTTVDDYGARVTKYLPKSKYFIRVQLSPFVDSPQSGDYTIAVLKSKNPSDITATSGNTAINNDTLSTDVASNGGAQELTLDVAKHSKLGTKTDVDWFYFNVE